MLFLDEPTTGFDPSARRQAWTVIDNLRALGKTILRHGDVRMPTINGYAYYYYRTSGMLRMVGKTVTAVGALARGKAHMGVAGWREFSHPRYERVIKDWQAKPPAGLTGAELLDGARALLEPYITDVLPVERAQEAFELAVAPTLGRTKIVLSVADVEAEPARQ